MFFDDLHILRTIDRCEREGLTGSLFDGQQLLQAAMEAPQPVHDIDACTSFVRELELAERDGLLTYQVMQTGGNIAPPSVESMGANNYLAYIQEIQLTPRGHDRARCRVFELEPPHPDEDDGKPITNLTFERIANVLESAYDAEHLRTFLLDSDVPEEMLPAPDQALDVGGLLSQFNGGPSGVRRTLRLFLGRWLEQDLDSGPNQDEARDLLEDLGRQGWFVRDDRLVRGDPIRRATVAPLLGGDLLSNFHPAIQEAARRAFSAGLRAEAVFEAFKAVELRVGELIGSDQTGMSLIGDALGGAVPRLQLNDLATRIDRDEQEGFTLIFKGGVQGVRNPKAHGRFEELEERRALDYLGLASLLMRRLDDAEARQGI
jgi:uncharacterized protein (TIGR02391 family)